MSTEHKLFQQLTVTLEKVVRIIIINADVFFPLSKNTYIFTTHRSTKIVVSLS